MLRIDGNSDVPVFQQLVDGIKAAVARGALKSGDAIPSVRQTAADALVNPNTVAKAYRELEREGIIYTQRGIGMFVADSAEEICRSDRCEALQEQMERLIREAHAAGLSDLELQRLFQDTLGRKAECRGGRVISDQ